MWRGIGEDVTNGLGNMSMPLLIIRTVKRKHTMNSRRQIRERKRNSKKLKAVKALAVDFFCGGGGVTRGFIDAGIHMIAGLDNDKNCGKTYSDPGNNCNRYDRSTPKYLEYELGTEKNGEDMKKAIEELGQLLSPWEGEGIPLIFSICPPCQPFTRLTKIALVKKTSDRREQEKNLFLATLPFIDRFSPDFIFSENVTGITKEERYGPVYREFCENLIEREYVVGFATVNAKYFNVPQNRLRNILLGATKKIWTERGQLPPSELDIPKKGSESPTPVKVRDVLGNSANPKFPKIKAGEADPDIPNHRASALSDKNRQRIRFAEAGRPNSVLAKTRFGDLRVKCHQKADKNGNTNHHNDVYSRMDPKRPAPTITTKCHSLSNGRYGYPYKNQDRAISLREAATLQSFPQDYRFQPLDGIISVARQIGNAVPPKQAEYFGEYLLSLLEGESSYSPR